ncbi:MAG: NAD(P)/FAD-dependent oxidoreductase [Pseudomonadota bacterium]
MRDTDVVMIGAGAAGLMCAATAARRGRKVVLLDHSYKLAEKIRISGGGRCNFTNLQVKPENYLSANPHFCRSALARFTPQHFMAMLDAYGIRYHEKKLGQMFCDEGSEAIIRMLHAECEQYGVTLVQGCEINDVSRSERFVVRASCGEIRSDALVVATGGLSIPKIGATPFGYRIAQQFGVPVTKLKAGLVPLSFHPDEWSPYSALSGVSLDAEVRCGKQCFRENLLFTHRGLSGPSILQISSYWEQGQPLQINLLPDHDASDLLSAMRESNKLPVNFLVQFFPRRFAEIFGADWTQSPAMSQLPDKTLLSIIRRLQDWRITPTGTLGYAKAEVTCGGVDTRALSSKTMQANEVPGLYFIGEVVDVTGQLGGYNFQWAWASGHAAGEAL